MIQVFMGYWSGDMETALELTEQMGKLLPEKSDLVSLCYVHRMDCEPPEEEIFKRDREKFHKVSAIPTAYPGTGWPAGCNAIAYTVLNKILPNADKSIQAGLILESDCVITRKDWDKEIWKEWLLTKKHKKMICGTVLPWGWGGKNGSTHVNAAALYHRDTASKIPPIQTARPIKKLAWDYYHGRMTSLMARDSPLFHLDYGRPTISARELFESPCLVYHGVKDNSARTAINKRFKL